MFIRRAAVLPVSILLAAILIALEAFAGDNWGDISDADWQVGPPPDYPEANSVILLDKCDISVSTSKIEMEYYGRLKVLTKAGIEEIGDWAISYDKEYDDFKRFKARTITPAGKKIDVDRKEIHEKTVEDIRQVTFAFPAVDSGCILEYRYSIVTTRFRYLRPWYFQNRLYTLNSEFSVAIAQGFNYNIQYQNVPGPQQQPTVEEIWDPNYSVSEGRKIKTYRWTMTNLLPVKNEPYMSCEDDYRSSMKFQLVTYEDPHNFIRFVKDWTELGKDWQTILDNYCNRDKDIARLADSVTSGLTSDREKSRALYDYVTTRYATTHDYNYSYFGGEQISILLDEMRGTGESKNLLLVRLHKALNIPAWPVFISTRDNAKFNPRFPDMRQFNYLIAFAQFDQDWEFLDASNRYSPYGVLPADCLTDGGFLVDGEKSQLVRMTIKPMNSVRIDQTRMYIGADGTVSCTTKVDLTGYYASSFGRAYESSEPEDFIKNNFFDKLAVNCQPGEHHCELDSLNQFVINLCYTSPELARKLDNNVVVTPVSYSFRKNPFESERRFFPVDFTYPFLYVNVVEVHVDGDVKDYLLPEGLSFEISGASYTRQAEVKDDAIMIVSKLSVDSPEFPPVRYAALKGFFQKVAESTHDELTTVLQ